MLASGTFRADPGAFCPFRGYVGEYVKWRKITGATRTDRMYTVTAMNKRSPIAAPYESEGKTFDF